MLEVLVPLVGQGMLGVCDKRRWQSVMFQPALWKVPNKVLVFGRKEVLLMLAPRKWRRWGGSCRSSNVTMR